MHARTWGRVTGGVVALGVVVGVIVANRQEMQAWRAPQRVKATRTAESTPAITQPTMIGLEEVTADYFEDVEGIAVEINGDARFYSFQILNWHEIVMDTVGGTPIAVTYSTLCGSAAVYANTGPVKLSGYMQETCSILEDEQGTQYLQPTGQKVQGQGVDAWTRVPSMVVRFSDWYPAHPNGKVLSLQTGVERVYSRHPLGDYDQANRVVGLVSRQDEVIPTKDLVWDILTPAGDRANVGIARSVLSRDGVQNIVAGDQAIVAFMDNTTAYARIFDARIDGRVLTFARGERVGQFVDQETGSVWNVAGEAVSGELQGSQLASVAANRLFGFAYVALFPTATIPGYEAAKAEHEAAKSKASAEEPAGEAIIVE